MDYAQNLLWSVKIKATIPRRAIVDILLQEKNPLPISEITKRLPHHSLASVYRTLKLLIGNGLVHEVHTGNVNASYELIHGKKHHHHLICNGCGIIEDVEKCLPRNIASAILMDSKKFSSLTSHSLEFFGICKKCNTSPC